MRPSLLLALLTLVPVVVHADYCADRSEAALVELSQALGSTPHSENRARALNVLEQLCRDAQGDAAPADSGAAANASAEAEEGESSKLFGIEIKEAPEGAPGYERARKGP